MLLIVFLKHALNFLSFNFSISAAIDILKQVTITRGESD